MSSKVTYKSILKEAITEFDTSKMSDVKGPMLEPILSYTGDGNLETHKDAASVLERYYFQEKEPSSVNIPDTGESVEIKQPEKEDLKDAPKVKDAIEDELEGKEGSLDKVTESDSVEERLLELEMSFLNEMEDSKILEEGETGPGGHVPDGTGPHGAGKGPGKGKADGSGQEGEEGEEKENEDKVDVKESTEISMEERLLQLEADLDIADTEEKEEASESPAEDKLEKETEDVSESVSDIENTVLEALFAEMDDANKPDTKDEKEVKEEKPAGDADIEKDPQVKDVLDIDKAVAEGGGLGPIDVTDEDVDLNEMLSMLEAEIENSDNNDKLNIPVEDIDDKSIRI